MKKLAFLMLLLGCSPDHRARIASKNGQDCALVHFVPKGLYPDWNVEGDIGPANFVKLDDAIVFAKQACGGGDVKVRIETPKEAADR